MSRPLPVRGEPALPPWIREKKLRLDDLHALKARMRLGKLSTVCEEARCPNRTECFERKTATFLIAGDVCTRACGFCHITSGKPAPLDPLEPAHLAAAARDMGLSHVVVTSVDRDDLDDGGAAHWAAGVRALKEDDSARTVEVLTPDFQGVAEQIDRVADAGPDVYNHNVETVPRLYESVRPGADFARSLRVLSRVRETQPDLPTKSGLMLGLGETVDEVRDVMRGLLGSGVTMLTLGQYLRPNAALLPVAEFVNPEVFAELERDALGLGFSAVASAPYVRSSYHAGELAGASHSS